MATTSIVSVKLMRSLDGNEIFEPSYEDKVENLLCELRVKHNRRSKLRVNVQRHEDGPLIEIVYKIVETAIPAIAGVVGIWLKNKAGRKIIVQTKDAKGNLTIIGEGHSAKEVTKLIRSLRK